MLIGRPSPATTRLFFLVIVFIILVFFVFLVLFYLFRLFFGRFLNLFFFLLLRLGHLGRRDVVFIKVGEKTRVLQQLGRRDVELAEKRQDNVVVAGVYFLSNLRSVKY